MSRYTFYSSLGLDRDRDPQQLAAQLDQWLKMPGLDRAQVAELQAARAILGDPVKRTEYDRRIDDPSAPDMTMAEMQELAARQSAPGWGRPDAGASAAAGSSATGPSVTDRLSSLYRDQVVPAASLAYGKTKEVFRTHPKPAIAVTAVAALAVVGLGVAGIKGSGGDDESSNYSTSSHSQSGSSSSSGSSGSVDRHAADKEKFDGYSFLKAGEELTYTSGQIYTYDDGHTEHSPEGGEYSVTVDNVRLIDRMSKVDPSAPADHPSAKSHKDATLVCYDVTVRIVRESADSLRDKAENKDHSPIEYFYGKAKTPVTSVTPIIDGEYLSSMLGDADMSVPFGSSAPIVYNEDRGWESEDGKAEMQTSIDNMSESWSDCHVLSTIESASYSNSIPVTKDGGEPENYSGYVVTAAVRDSSSTPEKDVYGWRFDH